MNTPTEPSDAIAQLIEHLRAGQKQLEELLTNGALPAPNLAIDDATLSILTSLSDLSAVPGLEELHKALPDFAQLSTLVPTPEQLAAAFPAANDGASPWPWPVASTPSPWPPPQRPSQVDDDTHTREEEPARRRGTSARPVSATSDTPSMRRGSAYPDTSDHTTAPADTGAIRDDADIDRPAPIAHPEPTQSASAAGAKPTSERGARSRRLDADEATLQAIDEELDDRLTTAVADRAEQRGEASATPSNIQALSDQLHSATEALMRGRRP